MGWEKSVREKTVRGGDVLTGGQWRNDGTRKGMNTDSIYRVGWRAVAISRISLYFYIGRRRILSPISKLQTKNRADHHSDAEGFFPFENQMRRLPTIGQALYQSFFFLAGWGFFSLEWNVFFCGRCCCCRVLRTIATKSGSSIKEAMFSGNKRPKMTSTQHWPYKRIALIDLKVKLVWALVVVKRAKGKGAGKAIGMTVDDIKRY